MQIVKISNETYEIGKVSTVSEMLPEKSIYELIHNSYDKEMTKKEISKLIVLIAGNYLMLNAKGKGITNEYGFKLISDYIMDECKNLELQEIEYIFKKGVLGRFGEIFNDISIDTICGKGGWIEYYCKNDRKNKPQKVIIHESERMNGTEMTLSQFFKKNPDFEKRTRLLEIGELAKINEAKLTHLKEFYKLKDLTLNDLKDDMESLSKQYYEISEDERKLLTWDEYLHFWINKFILDNLYKVKQ